MLDVEPPAKEDVVLFFEMGKRRSRVQVIVITAPLHRHKRQIAIWKCCALMCEILALFRLVSFHILICFILRIDGRVHLALVVVL